VDVVVGSWAYPDGFAAVVLAGLLGIPAVIKLHGSDMNVVARLPGPRRCLEWALPRAERVVAVSKPLREAAIAFGVTPDRVDIVPNGIDRARFRPRDRGDARRTLGLPQSGSVVLYVGNIELHKGTSDLIRAFAPLARRRDVSLIMLGDGTQVTECGKLAAELAVPVRFVGPRPHEEVPSWMAACDVLALELERRYAQRRSKRSLAGAESSRRVSVGRRTSSARTSSVLVPPGIRPLTSALEAAVSTHDPITVSKRSTRRIGGEARAASTIACSPLSEAARARQHRMGQLVRLAAGYRGTPRTRSRPSITTAGRRVAKRVGSAILPASMVVWRGPALHVQVGRRAGRVALTFDDGPTALTEGYLELLARFNARATFFVIGELCAQRPDLVTKIAKAGHELAGHGYTHRRFPTLSGRELEKELRLTAALLPRSAGRSLVRPPHGAVSPWSMLACARAGFTTALWSYDSGDWRTERADEVFAAFEDEEASKPGAIILLHEGQTWTMDALPRILGKFRKADHDLVTMGELLHG
jgi:peptidoglycan/xylan/chitin deacetylase (PgdA/CDA1 family)